MDGLREIDAPELARRLHAGEPTYLVDVRQRWERETAVLPGGGVLVPLNELPARADEIDPPPGAMVVTYCHHGVRSLHAAAFLLQRAGFDEVRSLAGGIDAWSRDIDPSVPRY